MKALIRWGIGLFGVLLAGSVSHAYVWVSPVTGRPLGYAPDMYSVVPMYVMTVDGRWIPQYYLRPPFPPHQGFLPGPIGQAIQSGYLPHELLQDKQAMTIGNMPLLKKHQNKEGGPGATPPPPANPGMPPYGIPSDCGAYTGPAYMNGGVPGPFPMMMGPGFMPPAAKIQTPYLGNAYAMGYLPNAAAPNAAQPSPPQGAPYGQGMPYPQPMMYPQPVPMPMMLPQRTPQIAYGGYYPYAGGPHLGGVQDRNVWQVQNAAQAPVNPYQPTANPMMPGQVCPPGGCPVPGPQPPMPNPGFQPMMPFNQFAPFGAPQIPTMGPLNMQMPRMDTMPPPRVRSAGSAFPTHPFTRSPRDFFMWGDNMEEERARGNRPFPVP